MTTSKRSSLDEAVKHAANGERVRVRRNGSEAVVVPVEDAALLEAIEDYIDVKDVRRRRAQAARSGAAAIPWERAKRKLRSS
jgi:hypothetical protein